MHRFYADTQGVIAGAEAEHLARVLRLQAGDEIEVLQEGVRYFARLTAVGKDKASYETLRRLPDNEPRCRVTLYQGLCKGERMEFVVQKCTEMGVHAIVPVIMERTVVRPSAEEGRLQRYQRIAREAVKQCGRSQVPQIEPPQPFARALARMGQHAALIMPYEEGGAPLYSVPALDIGLLIGPEGGIAPQEAGEVAKLGGQAVTLGPRILRTETAGLVALTLLLHLQGDLGGGA